MSVQLSRRRITVDEYYRMAEAGILTEKDRVELIHGEIIEISPIGSKHAAAVNRLNNVLKEYLGVKAIVSVQNPIKLNNLNEPEPDIAVLKYADHYYAERHPSPADILMVVEVSDTTLAFDREIKLPLYAHAGIPEFWLVDLGKKELEIHRNPAKDIYKNIQIIQPGDTVDLPFELSVSADFLLG